MGINNIQRFMSAHRGTLGFLAGVTVTTVVLFLYAIFSMEWLHELAVNLIISVILATCSFLIGFWESKTSLSRRLNQILEPRKLIKNLNKHLGSITLAADDIIDPEVKSTIKNPLADASKEVYGLEKQLNMLDNFGDEVSADGRKS
jgi:low affinity Fe/Cu permease